MPQVGTGQLAEGAAGQVQRPVPGRCGLAHGPGQYRGKAAVAPPGGIADEGVGGGRAAQLAGGIHPQLIHGKKAVHKVLHGQVGPGPVQRHDGADAFAAGGPISLAQGGHLQHGRFLRPPGGAWGEEAGCVPCGGVHGVRPRGQQQRRGPQPAEKGQKGQQRRGGHPVPPGRSLAAGAIRGLINRPGRGGAQGLPGGDPAGGLDGQAGIHGGGPPFCVSGPSIGRERNRICAKLHRIGILCRTGPTVPARPDGRILQFVFEKIAVGTEN